MKVKELINILSDYNQESEINIVVGNTPHNLELTYGTSEGCTKETCEIVSLEAEGLNSTEE